jgi:dipeptidyl aminopeptidase/acylaminoacyl peptidase
MRKTDRFWCAQTGGVVVASLLTAFWMVTAAAAQWPQSAGFDPAPVHLEHSESHTTRPVTSMDLLTLRDPKGVRISPDGKWVAVVIGQAVYEANAYRSALFLVSTSTNEVRSLGTAGAPHWDEINQWSPEDPQWSPDSRTIWYRARLHDSEHWQAWSWSVGSGQSREVTHAPGNVENCRLVSDGRALFLTVGTRVSLHKAGNSYEPGILFPGPIRPYLSIPIETQIGLAQAPRREYWIHDLKTGRERRATAVEIKKSAPEISADVETTEQREALAKYHVSEAKSSPDGLSVAYTYVMNDVSDSPVWAQRLLLFSKQTHAVKELTPDAHFVNQFWWNGDGTELYFTRREGRGRSHELWKASADGSRVELLFKPAGTEYLSSFSSDDRGQWFACLVENNTTPPQVALLDRASHQVRMLLNVNPEFSSLEKSAATRIEGTNRYGENWYGYFVQPFGYKPGKRYPLIVTTYRAGDYFLRGASGDQNPIQVYAAKGFAVLCFDVGMIRNIRPGHFEDKLLDWTSPTASLEAAIQELDARGLIDPERVGIAGFSHGEEIAGYALTHTNVFRAATGAAMYEPCFYFLGGTEWWDLFKVWGLDGWPGGPSGAKWQQISMAMNADRIRTPILETVSDTEYLTYLPLYRSLVDLQKPVELYIYPTELHVRNQPRHRLEIYERNLDWFSFWLKGEERPGEEKREQYERWRKMRDESHPSSVSRPDEPTTRVFQ